jgi:YidC/Oxa1 family membrane protein insertase
MFTEIIYRPLLNLTVFLYETVGFADLGIAIVIITTLVRLVLLPMSLKTARSQKAMAALAPEIEELKKKHKDNAAAQSEAIMALYKARGVNPLGGCLPLVIQLPILIGMYRVFLHIFDPATLNLLYSFVSNPGVINTHTLGVLDISVRNPALAVVTGIAQFVQARMSLPSRSQKSPADAMTTQMMYILPVMIVVISWNLPAGLALYWLTTTLFSVAEQLYLRRQ